MILVIVMVGGGGGVSLHKPHTHLQASLIVFPNSQTNNKVTTNEKRMDSDQHRLAGDHMRQCMWEGMSSPPQPPTHRTGFQRFRLSF